MGMVKIPFGIAKASTSDVPQLKTLCSCGGRLGMMEDDDGNKVACKECEEAYSYWNAAPAKGYKLGDEYVIIDPDDLSDEPPVETGNVEKVVGVKRVLLHYAVEGNYYLLPEEDHADQYGVLVAVLNEQDWALLTYLQMRSKTRRYAVISEGGVLLALQLADKKALPDLDYGTDEAMEGQAATMLEGLVEDDPALADVEGHAIKEAVRESVEPQAFAPDEEDAPLPEV